VLSNGKPFAAREKPASFQRLIAYVKRKANAPGLRWRKKSWARREREKTARGQTS